MLKQSVEKALNNQLNAELYAWYLYLSMANYSESKNFTGFAHWLKLQAKEEMEHAMKFYEYINRVSGNVELMAIKEPPKEWKSFINVFEDVLKHEKFVTESIHKIVDLSVSEKDHATTNFLQWFIEEQVEEEENATYVLEKIKLIGDNTQGLLFFDKELSQR